MIPIGKIQFGHLDAKHELFNQERLGQHVFMNAFQIPPSVNIEELLLGARFFITGLKGSGKTAMILYLRDMLSRDGAKTDLILFKSKLTEPERQRLIKIHSFSTFTDQHALPFQYDYKTNWLWFIITNLTRLIDESEVVDGKDYLHDLRQLTGYSAHVKSAVFSGLQITKIKAAVAQAISAGPFKTTLSSEIEAIRNNSEHDFIDIVNICEAALANITLKPGAKVALFFDELELFVNKADQRNRDLHLIRDLIYSVSRINQSIGSARAQIVVYASVRNEVLNEVNRLGPELERDVSDFGADISWSDKADSENNRLLNIVSEKIRQSEIEQSEHPTTDTWNAYFKGDIKGKNARNYILDISMFKPRNIISRLTSISEQYPTHNSIVEDMFKGTETKFSNSMWREVEEELLTSFSPEEVRSLKMTFTGFKREFSFDEFQAHVDRLIPSNPRLHQILRSLDQKQSLMDTLYRIGAIGNIFYATNNGRKYPRNRWAFREHPDIDFGKKIVVHESLLKALQL